MVVFNKVEANNKLEVVLYYSTMTWLYVTPFLQRVDRLQRADRYDGCLVPRSIGCYDRYRYSAPIAPH
ncbi:hypothetical protein L249_5502, partial [Ophiocordyceps polyrhachis-furcata BCC 54312]